MESGMAALGPGGAVLQRRARGEDFSQVSTDRETKSISAEETFAQDLTDEGALRDEVTRLAGRVAASLDRHGLVTRTVTLKLRDAGFQTITRSHSREQSTAAAAAIANEALRLLMANWEAGEPVRLIGVGTSNLRPVHAPGQLMMGI